jgi:hypothetical protein
MLLVPALSFPYWHLNFCDIRFVIPAYRLGREQEQFSGWSGFPVSISFNPMEECFVGFADAIERAVMNHARDSRGG